jgi:hypothetical protein
MWAMIPMLRQRSNGACLGISLSLQFCEIRIWGRISVPAICIEKLLAAGY